MQSIDSIETYAYGLSKDLICKKGKIKHNNIIKDYKMFNFDYIIRAWKNIIQKWALIPDHWYRILIIGGSGSRKTNALLNLINNEPDIDKLYLYAKDSCKE